MTLITLYIIFPVKSSDMLYIEVILQYNSCSV